MLRQCHSCTPQVIEKLPRIKYIIVGGGDSEEVQRIKRVISELGLDSNERFGSLQARENDKEVKRQFQFQRSRVMKKGLLLRLA